MINQENNIGKIKLAVAGVVITGLAIVGFGLASNVLAKDTDYKVAHQELDQVLLQDLDSWINSTAVRRFCMPKARLLQEELEIRQKLGDDITELQARKDRVVNECSETVKQVLFQ